MSYSFAVRAATKDAVIEAAREKFAEVVKSQPVHAADVDDALAAATAFVRVLADDDTQDVTLSVSGYVSGRWSEDYKTFKGVNTANVSITAAHATRAVTGA